MELSAFVLAPLTVSDWLAYATGLLSNFSWSIYFPLTLPIHCKWSLPNHFVLLGSLFRLTNALEATPPVKGGRVPGNFTLSGWFERK